GAAALPVYACGAGPPAHGPGRLSAPRPLPIRPSVARPRPYPRNEGIGEILAKFEANQCPTMSGCGTKRTWGLPSNVSFGVKRRSITAMLNKLAAHQDACNCEIRPQWQINWPDRVKPKRPIETFSVQ